MKTEIVVREGIISDLEFVIIATDDKGVHEIFNFHVNAAIINVTQMKKIKEAYGKYEKTKRED